MRFISFKICWWWCSLNCTQHFFSLVECIWKSFWYLVFMSFCKSSSISLKLIIFLAQSGWETSVAQNFKWWLLSFQWKVFQSWNYLWRILFLIWKANTVCGHSFPSIILVDLFQYLKNLHIYFLYSKLEFHWSIYEIRYWQRHYTSIPSNMCSFNYNVYSMMQFNIIYLST